MDALELRNIIEALILSSTNPLSMEQLQSVFEEDQKPSEQEILDAITQLNAEYANRAI